MKKLLALLVLAVTGLALAGCGGGGTILVPGGGGGGGATVSSVQLIASSPQLSSDTTGAASVTITALVRDAGNAVIEGLAVSFSTSSGSITVTQPTTDALGQAVATLTNGQDPTNRAITITATAGTVSGQVTVNVVGTTVTVTGPSALAQGAQGTYTVLVRDSNGVGISGRAVTVSSATGNTLSAASLTTSAAGQAQFTVTATASGADTLSAQALGLTGTATLNVSSDLFQLLAPTAAQEIQLGAVQSVQVQWTVAGVTQNDEPINFSSTRGTLSASSRNTGPTNGDPAGQAIITISSNNAGAAVISATNDQGTTASVAVEFVASDAETVDLQAVPFTVATGQQSQLTAIVRDPSGNLVKNETVVFVLTDNTGGFLSVGSDVTDSQGRAQTVYTGGSVPSASNGVSIQAVVQGETNTLGNPVQDTVQLTVAQREVDISIGTGDELFEPTSALYAKEWAIIVTDTVGDPVANTTVQTSIRSVRYRKGYMTLSVGTDPDWFPVYTATDGIVTPTGQACTDEDVDFDGFLSPAEDDPAGGTGFGNGNGRLDAGNRATVVPLAANAPADACDTLAGGGSTAANVTTNSSGVARVCVVYTQSDNLWVDVRLKALLSVFGSEFEESQVFTLEALAADLDDDQSSPSGQHSPFGEGASCRAPD